MKVWAFVFGLVAVVKSCLGKLMWNPIAEILIKKYSEYYNKSESFIIKESHLEYVFKKNTYLVIFLGPLIFFNFIIFFYFQMTDKFSFSVFLISNGFCFIIIVSAILKSIRNVQKLDTFLLGQGVVGAYSHYKVGIIGGPYYTNYIKVQASGKMRVLSEVTNYGSGKFYRALEKKLKR